MSFLSPNPVVKECTSCQTIKTHKENKLILSPRDNYQAYYAIFSYILLSPLPTYILCIFLKLGMLLSIQYYFYCHYLLELTEHLLCARHYTVFFTILYMGKYAINVKGFVCNRIQVCQTLQTHLCVTHSSMLSPPCIQIFPMSLNVWKWFIMAIML